MARSSRELVEALQLVRGTKLVDVIDERAHGARLERVVAQPRIEPDQPARVQAG